MQSPSPPQENTPAWLRPFQRVISAGSHVREIDGLRFIALAFVVLLHLNHYVILDAPVKLSPEPATSPLGRMLDQGDFGVRLFFAISGFILSLPFLRQYTGKGNPVRLKKYFLRRLTRLEPPLIINLVLMLGLMVLVMTRPLGELFPHFLASCAYLHTAVFGSLSVINPVIWSLEVEAQFYILMPVLAQFFRIGSFVWRQVLLLLLVVIFGLTSLPFPKASLTEHLEYFLIGFVLADWWLRWGENPRKRRAFDFLAVAAWSALVGALYWNRSIPAIGALLPALAGAAMLTSLRSPCMSWLLSHWIPVTLGGMCYTIYLYHLAIISAAARVVTPLMMVESYYLNYLLHAAIVLPLIIGISMILFALFERPFMSWQPWSRKRRTEAGRSP
ncbi:MAG: acyltransferase [Verrucomicrobiaceae bacterium]|nr:MAG: acyltransferase [Verrucomicrobiaceae bacterium]